ncbi:hypothetical protein B0T21DRAFT_355138 [Apiosordaria backusii]|uniref:Deubiquitination-protection protein dph1 n=1 Tax=Apiosordaria backusii TaxID=314023 RepID=A0AA40EYB8_9PEZI|nr:hypothetical protein B0T21DRAFT_355138 [Apiosordaria backusii]
MADNAETGNDAQITFKVKASNDKIHTITMSESATVLDLKTKLAEPEFENIPAGNQRLIYSGRILKDADALSVYKIKNLNTIHLVKSAQSNAAASSSASTSTPTPPAVPQNMAAGTPASNLLAGLTGARFAGHAPLPNRDLFGADGGMGAPPSEDQMADMLSNPAIAQSMNEALNNPAFVDHMIQSNPMLASMPNAREMLQSPYFRQMMTNPEAIRFASRMRRMAGGQGGAAFPAPGVTDTTPSGAAGSEGANAAQNPFGAFPGLFGGFPGAGGAGGAAGGDPFASLLGFNPFAPPPGAGAGAAAATPSTQTPGQTNPASPTTGSAAGASPGTQGQGAQAPPVNPFAALFGAPAAGAGAGGVNPANPFGMSAEEFAQVRQALGGLGGLGGLGAFGAPPAPPDVRPPEERYAEQLRQLNDMGFFDFDRNVAALRRSGGSVQGAIEHLLNGS